jgi:hypothetical protein
MVQAAVFQWLMSLDATGYDRPAYGHTSCPGGQSDDQITGVSREPSRHYTSLSSAQQATCDIVYTELRRVLREGVQAGPGADEGIDSLERLSARVAHQWSLTRSPPGSVITRR